MDVQNPLFRNCTSVRSIHDGLQRFYHFPNGIGASAVRHSGSYGGKENLYELAVITYEDNVFDDKSYDIKFISSITGIADVAGWLTESGVERLLEKIKAL